MCTIKVIYKLVLYNSSDNSLYSVSVNGDGLKKIYTLNSNRIVGENGVIYFPDSIKACIPLIWMERI